MNTFLNLNLLQVWGVLTDYDRLAEFVPNLAVSQRIALPPGAPPNVVRLRQVRQLGVGGLGPRSTRRHWELRYGCKALGGTPAAAAAGEPGCAG